MKGLYGAADFDRPVQPANFHSVTQTNAERTRDGPLSSRGVRNVRTSTYLCCHVDELVRLFIIVTTSRSIHPGPFGFPLEMGIVR